MTALRETSIVFALFIGVFFMKERLDLMKVVSTFLTLVVIPAVFMIPSDVANVVRKLTRLFLWPLTRLRRGEDAARSAALTGGATEDVI